jgi:hypothetical protein
MRMSRTWRIACAVMALGVGVANPARAQDSNYWSSAYGTRSQLLGGVVTGSAGDISATYYNPGAFALARSAELLLAANAWQYQQVSIDDGSGPQRTLSTSSLDAAPSFFAGELPILKRARLAYAFLTRRTMDMTVERRVAGDSEPLLPIPASAFGASAIQIQQSFSEDWFGVSWARSISPTLGFGISPFLVVRDQHTRASLFAEGRDSTDRAAALAWNREFNYTHWSVLARVGLFGVRDSLTWGATLTTPNLGISGGGGSDYNTTLVDQTGRFGTITGANYQTGLAAHFRTPLGVAAGASYGRLLTRVHAAVEWYAEVPRYTVLETAPFVVHMPGGDSTVKAVVTDRLHDVINWGIGIEHHFGLKVGLYASYHTDHSGRQYGEPPGGAVTRWNLHHVGVGAMLHVFRSDLALGFSAATAKQPTPPLPLPPGVGVAARDLETREVLLTVALGWKLSF